ncbi:MAG: transposase, partial [Pseudanabaena sp. M125S2SP2A07QC]|nr:transposase [Pseudanabaena sp. M125S2SP2A07QC]
SLSERTHQCSHCGTVLDRDHNAALNILAIGLKNTVGHTEISTPVESLTSAS